MKQGLILVGPLAAAIVALASEFALAAARGAARRGRGHLRQSLQRGELADQDRLRSRHRGLQSGPHQRRRNLVARRDRRLATTRLDRKSGDLTVTLASATGGNFLYDRCKLRELSRVAEAAPPRGRSAAPKPEIGATAMAERLSGVKASVGFASETGPRERNEDFAGAVFGWELPQPRRDVVAAIADGIGGAKGGRVAAETAVRGFLDGFCDLPETMEVRRAAATSSRCAQLLDLFPRSARRQVGGNGMHLHRVGAARPHRRTCCMSATRAPIGWAATASCCLTTDHVRKGGARPIEHPHPRARRRNGGAAGLRHPAGRRGTTASCCAATACTAR